MKNNKRTALISGALLALILLLLCFNTPTLREFLKYLPKTPTHNSITPTNKPPPIPIETPESVVLVVNKSIEEWKQEYREYIREYVLWEYIESNPFVETTTDLNEIIRIGDQIINNATNKTVLLTLHGVDPVSEDNYVQVYIKIYIPKFVLDLYRETMIDAEPYPPDPLLKELGKVITEYVEKTGYGYEDFRKAYIILTAVEDRFRYGYMEHPSPYTLQFLLDGYGICSRQSVTAETLLEYADLWVAGIALKYYDNPEGHARLAVHIDKFPPWFDPPIPYNITVIYPTGNTSYVNKTMKFYVWDVTWKTGFIEAVKPGEYDVNDKIVESIGISVEPPISLGKEYMWLTSPRIWGKQHEKLEIIPHAVPANFTIPFPNGSNTTFYGWLVVLEINNVGQVETNISKLLIDGVEVDLNDSLRIRFEVENIPYEKIIPINRKAYLRFLLASDNTETLLPAIIPVKFAPGVKVNITIITVYNNTYSTTITLP